MRHVTRLSILASFSAILCIGLSGCGGSDGEIELVNLSYDPTRELYKAINKRFEADYGKQTGKSIRVTQSHGGSGAQARSVIDGNKADVVTLALAGDIEAIEKRGLIDAGWQKKFDRHAPNNNACPYTSTIVFVVRKGNPAGVSDWLDLEKPGVKIITPNPKTSGGARWNFLAAWGYHTFHLKKSDDVARTFLRTLYGKVVRLDTGARGSTDTFLSRREDRDGQNDVLIAWENEALLLVKGKPELGLEIRYPKASIRAEPPVAVVDKFARERGNAEHARAYLDYLYSEKAQEIVGRNHYRPYKEEYRRKYASHLPGDDAFTRFTLADVVGNWDAANDKFFAAGKIFDQIQQGK